MYKYKYIGTPPILTTSGLPIATNLHRIVHGGRGAYVEFMDWQLLRENLHIPPGTEWRLQWPYSERAYYVEYRTTDGIKVYHQKRMVDYANYLPGRWYISPVHLKDFIKGDRYQSVLEGA